MDFSGRITNISAVLFRMGGGSYDKLYRQIHGTMPVTRESRARAIEAATDGAIGWQEILQVRAPAAAPPAPLDKAI